MLRVDVQATGTSNHDQSRVSTGEDVREMLQRRGVLGEGFRRPCAERVDDHIESGEICCGQVEQILDDGVLGDGFVLPAHNSSHVKSAINGLPDNELAGLAVGCDNCDVLGHDGLLCGNPLRLLHAVPN